MEAERCQLIKSLRGQVERKRNAEENGYSLDVFGHQELLLVGLSDDSEICTQEGVSSGDSEVHR